MMVITIAASIAVPKESIWKPFIKFEAIRRSKAFITKRKSPKVRMVAGSVSKIRTGLIRRFKIPSTAATIKAVLYESILKPGMI